MAIKSRLLSKLKSTYVTMNMAAASHPQKMHPVLHNLVEAKSLCQQGLTEENFAKYGEVYDGLIMAIRQILSGEAGKEAREIVGLCKELLEHIVLETSREEHFKKEMVFLPYKASMWDSLESVWRAAYEDKDNCLAYVVPIPYCDRNPDGTAKEWHCERDLFPQDVPTLDWQEVDLKHMHPDVIFYHYPYDNCNRVTSPDEAFYSRNLKECADKLIYIPYFVLEEPEFDYDNLDKADEVKEAEDKLGNYILEPGVLNADLIIVQSEAMKKVYVNVLKRHTNASERYWEEHILGVGSPKFDKVAESRKEDFQLPEEWVRLIRGRKTILYNTGLTAMLENADKYLGKVQSVLATFKAQDGVVLWWRPHPLLRATLQSMHPELLQQYDEILNIYRQEGWGIYDDTAELERAVACTDGYYGDMSSIVHLYNGTGKKSVIQNCKGEYGEEWIFNGNTHFTDAVYYGDYLYFSEFSFNGLFRCKKGSDQAEFIGRFPGEEIWQRDMHRNVYLRNDKLYFIPSNGHGISVYNCDTGEFSMLGVTEDTNKLLHYIQCVEIDDKIFMIPFNVDTPFAIFDMTEERVHVIPAIFSRLKGQIPQPSRFELFSAYCAVVRNKEMYIAVSETNLIIKLNLSDYKTKVKKLPIEIHIRYMNIINGIFYFTAQEHVIVAWDEISNIVKKYDIPYEPLDDKFPYVQVVPYNDDLLIMSGCEDRLWKLNTVSLEWKDLMRNIPVGFERDFKRIILFLGYRQEEGHLVFYPRAGNGILILDKKSDKFKFKAYRYSNNVADFLRRGFVLYVMEKESVVCEYNMLLDDFIKYIMSETREIQDKDLHKVIGEKIYNVIS